VDDAASAAMMPLGTIDQLGPDSPIRPFLLGTVVGGIAGAAVGTALSPHTRGFVVGLYQLLNRRLSSAERDRLRFELLLQ
jgi:hypothetical protein